MITWCYWGVCQLAPASHQLDAGELTFEEVLVDSCTSLGQDSSLLVEKLLVKERDDDLITVKAEELAVKCIQWQIKRLVAMFALGYKYDMTGFMHYALDEAFWLAGSYVEGTEPFWFLIQRLNAVGMGVMGDECLTEYICNTVVDRYNEYVADLRFEDLMFRYSDVVLRLCRLLRARGFQTFQWVRCNLCNCEPCQTPGRWFVEQETWEGSIFVEGWVETSELFFSHARDTETLLLEDGEDSNTGREG